MRGRLTGLFTPSGPRAPALRGEAACTAPRSVCKPRRPAGARRPAVRRTPALAGGARGCRCREGKGGGRKGSSSQTISSLELRVERGLAARSSDFREPSPLRPEGAAVHRTDLLDRDEGSRVRLADDLLQAFDVAPPHAGIDHRDRAVAPVAVEHGDAVAGLADKSEK